MPVRNVYHCLIVKEVSCELPSSFSYKDMFAHFNVQRLYNNDTEGEGHGIYCLQPASSAIKGSSDVSKLSVSSSKTAD